MHKNNINKQKKKQENAKQKFMKENCKLKSRKAINGPLLYRSKQMENSQFYQIITNVKLKGINN